MLDTQITLLETRRTSVTQPNDRVCFVCVFPLGNTNGGDTN